MAGWYLRADLGERWGFLTAADTPSPFINPTTEKSGMATMGGLGAGFRYKWVRADFTVDYATKQKYEGTAVTSGDVTAKMQTSTGLFNVYADLGTWYRFTPYIGAGIGAARVTVSELRKRGGAAVHRRGLAFAMESRLGRDGRCRLPHIAKSPARPRLPLPELRQCRERGWAGRLHDVQEPGRARSPRRPALEFRRCRLFSNGATHDPTAPAIIHSAARSWALAALLAAMASSSAYAADYSAPGAFPDFLRGTESEPASAPTYPRWEGFYFGGQAGKTFGTADFGNATRSQIRYILANTELEDTVSDWTTLPKGTSGSQSYGGFIGYNYQWGEVVTGFELNYNHMGLNISSTRYAVGR